jgi:SAM-dependent methyltransferase
VIKKTKSEVNEKRWLKAQQAEKNFWIREYQQTSQHIDPTGEDRSVSVECELSYFGHEVVGHYLSDAACIVEVGCGPIGLIHFVPTPALRIGLDPLIRSMERSGYRARRGVFRIEARGEELPLRSDKADLVICYNVLDHCESPNNVLAEIHRILKPGGILLLQLYTILGWAAKFRAIFSWLDSAHPFHFSKSQVLRMTGNAGFELEFDGSFKRPHRRVSANALLSCDGLRHVGSNWITQWVVNLRLRKSAA